MYSARPEPLGRSRGVNRWISPGLIRLRPRQCRFHQAFETERVDDLVRLVDEDHIDVVYVSVHGHMVFGNVSMMTDESAIYPTIGREFAGHGSVNHSAEEYVKTG